MREPVLLWWDFAARSEEEIAAARADWEAHQRSADVTAYRGSRLAAPPFAPEEVITGCQSSAQNFFFPPSR
ncbi:MAG: hypothetical protein JNK48_01550 [Bryobacterales bacterium]|nr:hypothetical protein [Bryobacterales bacterium]